MKNTPIIITGCQRSGTTLMRMILNSHPEILSIDEDRFRYPQINTYLNANWLPSFVCFKLPQYAALLEFLKSFPGLKLIWCTRDPMDTVWSMMKLKVKLDEHHSVPWAAHPACAQAEIVDSYWSLNEITKGKLSEHMDMLWKIASKEPVERSRYEIIFTGALCWTIKNAFPERYKEENIEFHNVSYEKLVTSPKHTIESILTYIGVDWSDDVLIHHEKHSGISIGDTSNTRPIDSRCVGQGMANFTQDEAEQIRRVCRLSAVYWHDKS